MPMEVVLSIVGSFVAIALGINGFFLRGIFQDLNDLKIKLATIIAESKSKQKEIDDLKNQNRDCLIQIGKLRERMHSVEGQNAQVLQFINDN